MSEILLCMLYKMYQTPVMRAICSKYTENVSRPPTRFDRTNPFADSPTLVLFLDAVSKFQQACD